MLRTNLHIQCGVGGSDLIPCQPLTASRTCHTLCAFRPRTWWPPHWSDGFSWLPPPVESTFPQTPGWPLLKPSLAPHRSCSPAPVLFLVSAPSPGSSPRSIEPRELKAWIDYSRIKTGGRWKLTMCSVPLHFSNVFPQPSQFLLFHNSLLTGLLSFHLTPKAILLKLPKACVVFLKYRSDHFTPLLKAFEWVSVAFWIKSKPPFIWLCALPSPPCSSTTTPQHKAPCMLGGEQFSKQTAAWMTSVCLSRLSLTIPSSRKPVPLILVRKGWDRLKPGHWRRRKDRLKRCLGSKSIRLGG